MSPGSGVIELVFVFGVALALGLWELWRIRRELRRTRELEREGRPDDQRGGGE